MGQAVRITHPGETRANPDWAAVRARLWRTAYALARSRSDADDLTQQTFAALLSKEPDRVKHTAYARRTMVRVWLDQQRAVRRRLQRVARWSLTRPRWHVDSDRVSEADQHARVQHAIELLPPRQRAVVVLRCIEELDYREIADVLDCPVQTVRANLHLARKQVRRALGEAL
ncbi:MAG: RNA polymerase sigma factor [Phycisphaerae bacterium]